eukprot:10107492-Lingulodinium_polyedra.AAC.1
MGSWQRRGQRVGHAQLVGEDCVNARPVVRQPMFGVHEPRRDLPHWRCCHDMFHPCHPKLGA